MGNADKRIFSALASDLAAEGMPFRFVARGRSMAPFLVDGDAVIIRSCDSDVRVGDIVLLRKGGPCLLLHRVIQKREGGVVTRGDACIEADGFSGYEDIIGRVSKIDGRRLAFHLFFPFSYLLTLVLRLKKYTRLFHSLRRIARKMSLLGIFAER